jgi:hypothetical protein
VGVRHEILVYVRSLDYRIEVFRFQPPESLLNLAVVLPVIRVRRILMLAGILLQECTDLRFKLFAAVSHLGSGGLTDKRRTMGFSGALARRTKETE